jgi:hypothetical protein
VSVWLQLTGGGLTGFDRTFHESLPVGKVFSRKQDTSVWSRQ